ncbi:MAG: ComF family protein [Clostridiales bacterium]|nr:ComF family protein [Clostridiales bacterium]
MEVRNFLDYIYPPRCPVCDRISAEGICASCRKEIVRIDSDYCLKCGRPLEEKREEYCPECKKRTHYFEQGRSLFSYQGRIRSSMYRLKYANRREYAAVYGREAAESLGRWIRQSQITRIVPVPLHPSRRRARGYNQAALVAREIGRQMDLFSDETLLFRTRKTAPLKMLTAGQRKDVLRGAFQVRDEGCRGARILLVDDIYTTGATADAAALCLRQAGALRVYVLSIAIGG